MNQRALQLVGGFDCGPLFRDGAIKRPVVRLKGKIGIIHRAQTRRATPPWVDMGPINALYAEARRLTRETGELYVVDHIVPKIGKTVSGLHVHWNLRVVHWLDNARKGAWIWPGMPFEQMSLL